MVSNKLALIAVGAACIVAAGAGGYLAQRQNTSPSTPLQASAGTSASATGLPHPVQETEAIVSRPTPTTPRPPSASSSRLAASAPPAVSRHDAAAAGSHTVRSEAPIDRPAAGSTPAAISSPIAQPESVPLPPRPLESVERVTPEPALLPEPPQKSYEELVVSADSVIGLQSETTVMSDRARVEDRVEARVTRDVKVGNRVAIPAGSRALGTVSQVERGGKFKEHARIAVRFQTVVLPDGTRLSVSTDAVIREGTPPGSEAAKKIGGGAVAGTILGAIIGGSKGAAIGGMAGAGTGAGMVAAGDRSVATLHAGEPMTVRLLSPVTVVSER